MKRLLILLAGLGLMAGPAAAQRVLFDFNNAPLHAPLPITLTEGGVTATLSATGQGFSVQLVDVVGFTPAGFSGYWLNPNSLAPSDLRVTFSATLTDFSIMYAPHELGCETSAVMRVTGFMNDVPVATNTTTAPNPGVWPTGLLTLSSAQGFNSVVIHYETRPACLDSAMDFMADNMAVTLLDESLFVPIVLSSSGAGGSFFTTELTLTNGSSSDATLSFAYVSGFGGGGGEGSDVVAAGRQRVVPGRDRLPEIPGNPDSRLREPRRHAARRRLGRAVPRDRSHRADDDLGRGRPGGARLLRSGARGEADRNVLALRSEAERPGPLQRSPPECGRPVGGRRRAAPDGFPGRPAAASATTLPDVTLPPGGWTQLNGILASNGLSLTSGYVRIERVSGSAPYLAYGVVNDQANSDGSYVPAVPVERTGAAAARPPCARRNPGVLDGARRDELVVVPKTLQLTYVADAIGTADHSAVTTLALGPGEQQILPDFVNRLRQAGTPGIGPAGATFAGSLFAEPMNGDLGGVVLGARVSTPGGGGRFGLFFTAQAVEGQTAAALWLFGLQQNGETRSNLAVVNLGLPGDPPDVFDIELYDGATGARAGTLSGVSLEPRAWKQVNAILSLGAPGVSNGYARVVRTSGTSPFTAYGVLNDGAAPGERTGDGAFVWAVP